MKDSRLSRSVKFATDQKEKSTRTIFVLDESKGEKVVMQKAQEAKANGRKLKLRKPKRQGSAKGLERQYLRRINKILACIEKSINEKIIKELPNLVAQNEKKKPTADSGSVRVVRTDINVAKKVGKLFNSVRFELRSTFPKKELEKITRKMAREVSRFNKNQVGAVFQSVLGVSLLSQEPHLAEDLEEFAIANSNLIQDLTNNLIAQTQREVFEGLRKGTRHEEIARKLLSGRKGKDGKVSRLRVSQKRAALIARDQVNKLNGNLTELRQTGAGVKRYKWRTVGDSRVRGTPGTPSAGLPLDLNHFKREGKIFSWDKPPADGHPGEPIQCRCHAEPILEDLI